MTTKKLSEIALSAQVVTDVTETVVSVTKKEFANSVGIGSVTVNGTETELSAPSYSGDGSTITTGTDGKFKVVDDVYAKGIKDVTLDLESMTLGQYLSAMANGLKGVSA